MREEELRLEAAEKDKSKMRKQAAKDRKEWLDQRKARQAAWSDFSKTVCSAMLPPSQWWLCVSLYVSCVGCKLAQHRAHLEIGPLACRERR